ncbi:MAG: NAD+ synthase [Candidatus Woesearchaeota archaeon]|nr:MAG: NAD+ synthase [Candidatus Woesearchaeota archaeon]
MKTHEARAIYRQNKEDLFRKTCPSVSSLVQFIKEKTDNDYDMDGRNAVIGLSGGLDSSVVAELAVRALGPKKVYGIMMPSDTNLSMDLEYAERHAKKLGIEYDIVPIDISYRVTSAQKVNPRYFRTKAQKGNLMARNRMELLYDKAWDINGMVFGTSNLSEYMVGYLTKHGDGAADIEPILPLYKTQVRQIAKELGVPKEIIKRKPTAGLWKNQTDEEELGITYDTLDEILLGHELGFNVYEISNIRDISLDEVSRVLSMVRKSRHKRRQAPSPKNKFIDIVAEVRGYNREDYSYESYRYSDKVLDELTSKDAAKEHMLNVLEEGKSWGWFCFKSGYDEDEIENIYRFIINAHDKFPEDIRPYVNNFEDAALDIILDEKTFFTKSKYGHPNTIGEYIGQSLAFELTYHDEVTRSPNMRDGTIAKKIIPHIKLNNIAEIADDEKKIVHQNYLVRLLDKVKTYETPGEKFWDEFKKSREVKNE